MRQFSIFPCRAVAGYNPAELFGLIGTLLLASALSVGAQQSQPSSPSANNGASPAEQKAQKNAQKKVKINQGQIGLTVDAGYLLRPGPLGRAKANDYFYKLQYQGQTVGEHGSAFQDANTYTGVNVPTKPGGDSPDLLLQFENGAGTATGPLANLLKIQPFQAAPTSCLGQLRGVAQVYGQINGGRISTALGLEGPPIAPLSPLLGKRFRSAGVTNWLIFGMQGAAENRANSSQTNGATQDGTDNLGMLTYRSYLATSGGWVYSQSSRNERKAMQDIADQASLKNFVALSNLFSQHEITKGSQTTNSSAQSSGDEKKTVADLVEKLSDAEKATVEKYMEAFYDLGPLVRLVKPDTNKIKGIQVGNQVEVFEDPINWELDITGFLKALQTEPTGTSLQDEVCRQLRDFFINGAPSVFPDLNEARLVLKPYLTSTPPIELNDLPAKARKDVLLLFNLALTEALLTKDRTALKTAFPQETQPQVTARDVFNQPIIDRNAARQKLINALGENDPIAKITENNKANSIDDSYASRLLVEKVYPAVLRGVPFITPPDPKRDIPDINRDVWNAKLKAFIADTFLLPDRPRYTLSFEAIGQWLAIADTYQGNRFRSLLAPSFTYFFNPHAATRQWLRIRYENGRDRTAPKDYRNQIMFTLGFDL